MATAAPDSRRPPKPVFLRLLLRHSKARVAPGFVVFLAANSCVQYVSVLVLRTFRGLVLGGGVKGTMPIMLFTQQWS